jgi:hypothetical protein
MAAVGDANKVCHDAKTITRLAHAALKNGGYIQATSNGSQIDMGPFERECGSPRSDAKILDLSKGVDDFISDSVCEKFILRIGAHVGEWQHDNRLIRRPGGYRRERSSLLFTGRFPRSYVQPQPLQIRVKVSGILTSQLHGFFKGLN